MKSILFVCIENSNRSQMAEAFGKILGKDKINAFSAGSNPSVDGQINPKAVEAMKMIGYDLTNHQSKSVDGFCKMKFDWLVTMGCGDECPFISANHREDWNIPDPKNLPMEEFIKVRDLIEGKVKELIKKIVSDTAD